ncbi:hypothetical protein BN1723_005949 [Verticillium longisporum]|uniref:DNA topoisomerase (ATP-hydrolyzing) n=1 Tax=Verticillium longisporum TaxID=100787 RepID=A0A0G4NC86_VERLO|nr:hypothetical protein BN1723_005949 [Verticillium longisporum]
MDMSTGPTATRDMPPSQPDGSLATHAEQGSQPSDVDFVQSTNTYHTSTASVIARIEGILRGVQDDLFHGRVLSIPYKARRPGTSRASAGLLRFPGSTPREASKFGKNEQKKNTCRYALVARNIFYQDVELFGSQANVDQLVDDLAFTLNLGRDDLNIVAAGKGLVSGPVTIHLQNGTQVDMSSGSTGVLIPSARDVVGMNFASTKWVLVIEKEAAFRPLAVQQYWRKSSAGHGVIVTGKGYPDLVTRSFLHAIQAMKPDMPIFCLVDFDPDGLRIMQCYKHGSQSLRHESHVVLPRLQWLGIRSADLMPDGQRGADGDREGVPRELPADPATVMPLSLRDRSCARKLLASFDEDGADVDDSEYRRELQIMLVLGVKGEIQAVDDVGDLTRWLGHRLLYALGGLEF